MQSYTNHKDSFGGRALDWLCSTCAQYNSIQQALLQL